MTLLLGILLAAASLGLAALVGLHRERAFYATILVAIASYYPVFGAAAGPDALPRQSLLALPFLALALIGFRWKRVLIAAGLAIHGLFDLAAEAMDGPAPAFWADLCLGFDAVMALAVLILAPGRRATEGGRAGS